MRYLMTLPQWPRFNYTDKLFDGAFNSFDVDANMLETDAAFTVSVDLPGYESKDIQIEVNERKLNISAVNTTRETKKLYVLPANINTDNISADLKLGVLTITLPKKITSRKIEIK